MEKRVIVYQLKNQTVVLIVDDMDDDTKVFVPKGAKILVEVIADQIRKIK